MVINPMCCCVDEVSGNIRLPVLSSWTQVRPPDPAVGTTSTTSPLFSSSSSEFAASKSCMVSTCRQKTPSPPLRTTD
ncbi:hypothetical protein F7725_010761 [Dissostichus mawsoni]|uniref:Uncharacterized protein n=1 Tax=Dissostichus mawsoni TaxID=36200 RepID=A0A7J5Z7I8_DISMA|nr:hypothetical protein F7725_010761 [Dissostichus mawsoni]